MRVFVVFALLARCVLGEAKCQIGLVVGRTTFLLEAVLSTSMGCAGKRAVCSSGNPTHSFRDEFQFCLESSISVRFSP